MPSFLNISKQKVFEEAGGMKSLRRKSKLLTAYLVMLLNKKYASKSDSNLIWIVSLKKNDIFIYLIR